ncbi:MAG: hypothetical protein M1828_000584 [Chrysothrix sp. TS-e1954]|nr:MAG: hypothetical protein M1828_000584 [Chrysothrix sp. TS-e1954]
MAVQMAMSWHSGEAEIQRRLHVPDIDNPTTPGLNTRTATNLQMAALLAVGTLDDEKKPWTSLWGGESQFARPLGQSLVGIRTRIDKTYDPVIRALFGNDPPENEMSQQSKGRMVSALTVNLDMRKRAKLYGRVVAGVVKKEEDEDTAEQSQAEAQLVVKVEQSLGNCPKYINCKSVEAASVHSKLIDDSAKLSSSARDLISKSDYFYLSSSNAEEDMDTNHRGGPQGFVRTHVTDDGVHQIIWPEYSGNRYYQTLGNLMTTPKAGLVFADFASGEALYVTGNTELLVGQDAAAVLSRSNVAVRLSVTRALHVSHSLPFRGSSGEASPYNPRVRALTSESSIDVDANKAKANSAKLIGKELITPTIARFRFTLSNPAVWKAGAWVAFDFSEEMDIGYSHMRDDDPRSLNDDFVRTFTVSSPPAPQTKASDDEFEITIRNVGRVTSYLFKQNRRSGLELPLRGFGGEFEVKQEPDQITPFVAGGVGITPILALLPGLDLKRLRLFWTLHVDDLDLVLDTLKIHTKLSANMRLYITGAGNKAGEDSSAIQQLRQAGVHCKMQRLQKSDLGGDELSNTWYVCVGTGLRKALLEWLEGKEVLYEDFNF